MLLALERTRPARSAPDTTEQEARRQREEKNWGERRPGMLDAAISTQDDQDSITNQRKQAERDSLQSVLDQWPAECPTCGCGHGDCNKLPSATVLWIGLLFCHRLRVPVFECPR